MIIASALQIQSLLAELSSRRLSSLLPVEVLVLKKLSDQTFLLQINSKTFETTSPKPLEVGQTYLASISKEPNKSTLFLNHLYKIPLKQEQALLPLETVISHFKKPSKESLTQLHSTLLSTLANSSSKEEFNFFTQVLLGLSQGLVSLPFNYKNGFGLLQYKRKQKQEKQSQDEVQFYAHLKQLGPLDGTVSITNDDVHVQINVLFEESLDILNELKEDFSFHHNMHIRLKEEISPLFVLNDKILDIKL